MVFQVLSKLKLFISYIRQLFSKVTKHEIHGINRIKPDGND